MPVLKVDDLPFSNIAHEFVGADHGGVGICVIVVDAPLKQVDIHVSPSFSTDWLD